MLTVKVSPTAVVSVLKAFLAGTTDITGVGEAVVFGIKVRLKMHIKLKHSTRNLGILDSIPFSPFSLRNNKFLSSHLSVLELNSTLKFFLRENKKVFGPRLEKF